MIDNKLYKTQTYYYIMIRKYGDNWNHKPEKWEEYFSTKLKIMLRNKKIWQVFS